MTQWSTDFFRQEFPALSQEINGHPLVYLDNAATSLKPRRVVDRLSKFYLTESANVHRGAHFLSDQATAAFENSRTIVAKFLGTSNSNEVIFTKGTTEGINLLARTLGSQLMPGDEVLLSKMEHHSNIVPWQLIAEEKSLVLKFVELNQDGSLNIESFRSLLSHRTKIVSFVHCSNALGTINPVKDLFLEARKFGAKTVLDAAQSVSFMPVNVEELECDFLVFSGHKIFAPTGIGVLWGREQALNELKPYQSGGSMIERVKTSKTTFLNSPHRFEAGTPHIAGAIGLGEALTFVSDLGIENIYRHEIVLAERAREELKGLPGIRFIGEAPLRANIVSFVFEGIHPSDLGQLLDREGIALRTGHHCTQPLMDYFGLPGTVRASFSIYNSDSDISRLVTSIRKALEILT